MALKLDWFSIINLIGLVNGFFITLVIVSVKKGDKTTNVILALLVAMFTTVIAGFVIWQTRFYVLVPLLTGVFANVYLTLGPLLYLYVGALTRPGFRFRKKDLFHFIPFVLNILYLLPFYLKSSREKIAIFKGLALHSNASYHVILLVRLVHLGIYLVLTVKLIRTHQHNIRQQHSSIEKIKLDWLHHLVIALSALLTAYILFYLFSVINYESSSPFDLSGKIFSLLHTAIVFFIGYKGLAQPDIFSREDAASTAATTTARYQKSTLTPAKAKEYLQDLMQFMEHEKPYLDSEITLKALAEKLSMSYFHLSQIINEHLDRNFYDFINHYRVKEAKELLETLAQYPGKTILDVAFAAGFNSKSTFNLVFKKTTGLTPSQYLSHSAKKTNADATS
jgi:AraC-like DNA-binding protein